MADQDERSRQDCTLSVADAIREAMVTRPARSSTITTPKDMPTPLPHLPLRKASAEKLQAKRAAPKPLWTPAANQLRGFSPSPVQAMPQMDSATASSEHAFAGRDDSRKKPFKPPLGVQVIKVGHDSPSLHSESSRTSQIDGNISRPPSSSSPSPLYLTPPESPRISQSKSVRSSRSAGEGFKGGRKHLPSPNRVNFGTVDGGEGRSSVPTIPSTSTAEVRDSFRSAVASSRVTSNSSMLHPASIHTEHSSLTATSSHTSEFVEVYPDWPETEPEAETNDEMTVDDAIGMYAEGFDSDLRSSIDTDVRKSMNIRAFAPKRNSLQESRPSTQPSGKQTKLDLLKASHRRSQSASLLNRVQEGQHSTLSSQPKSHAHTFSKVVSSPAALNGAISARASVESSEVPRDRYGFKKASLYITVKQYDAWNVHYSEHLERRRTKWHTLMESYGLNADHPFRFPPKSDKVKRYVRKGIPAEFRGAAWFWYAGGPSKMAKEPGQYFKALEKVKDGKLSDNDKDHIERDLHRTFPDNVCFKPDPSTMMDAQAGAGGGDAPEKKNRRSTEPETSILQALRRVLQAFAAHNPSIGYCQSLNFIAGLLLLFLDQDEEKTFILLNIVTTTHLPGTHGVALEGANIDIAVLMSCIKDALPAIWAKLDDGGGAQLAAPVFPGAQALRLPTVSLATTAWFMSLFVGTLPIEAVLRIWDCLFFEGSKTLFRVALAIFKYGEKQILAVHDPMEIFQVVQTIPRGMLDINGLMEVSFRRRGGFAHVSQGLIESRREERRQAIRDGVANMKEVRMSVWKGRFRAKTKVS